MRGFARVKLCTHLKACFIFLDIKTAQPLARKYKNNHKEDNWVMKTHKRDKKGRMIFFFFFNCPTTV